MEPLRPLAEQTVVIVGASSGIGRATALRAAGRGARVVVAARNEAALRDLEAEIRGSGGQALAVPADITDESQMDALAARASEAFGDIDTWVNMAGVSVYGRFVDIPVEDARRVMEVNYIGHILGARAALPYLQRTPSGALIFVGSGLSDRAVPLQYPYCASKSAVKALTESLRVELAREGSGVQVTLVKPSSIDTPFFAHARSLLGVMPRPVAPVYDPRLVADAILHAAEHRMREVTVGGAGKALAMTEAFAGPLLDAALARLGGPLQRTNQPQEPGAPNNLRAPVENEGHIRGDFGGRSFSVYTWSRLHPRATLAAGAALAGAAASWRIARVARSGVKA